MNVVLMNSQVMSGSICLGIDVSCTSNLVETRRDVLDDEYTNSRTWFVWFADLVEGRLERDNMKHGNFSHLPAVLHMPAAAKILFASSHRRPPRSAAAPATQSSS